MSERELEQRAGLLVNQVMRAFDVAPRGHSPAQQINAENADRIVVQHFRELHAAWNRRQPISEEALAVAMADVMGKLSFAEMVPDAQAIWRDYSKLVIAHMTGKAGT